MTRHFTIATALIFATWLMGAYAQADSTAGTGAPVVTHGLTASEFSAQSQRILRRRIPVYRRALGPNAVRVCNAHYVQEYRPSGTVITPRMNCYWQG